MDFPTLLQAIDERSAAFRAAIAAAPDLDAEVPTCPGWTMRDLAQHLGTGRRRSAAVLAAGPADTPPDPSAWAGPSAPRDRAALVAWLADATRDHLAALREAGPDRGVWTWWGRSQSPQTSGAVARHQVQEVAVHTYDAQLAAGAPQPLPGPVALDGVEEFQVTCCSTTVAWPHEPAVVDYHATEGRSWRLRLSAVGARVEPLTPDPDDSPADASATGTASDLVLCFYNRVPLDSLEVEGDRRIFDRLIAWDPSV